MFAQRFLDSRELLGLANPDKTIKARIHLHNNAAGRRVSYYTDITCINVVEICSVTATC